MVRSLARSLARSPNHLPNLTFALYSTFSLSLTFLFVCLFVLDAKNAELGADDTLTLLKIIEDEALGEEWFNNFESILETFRKKSGRIVFHNLLYY